MRVRAVRKEKAGEIQAAGWVDRTRGPYAEGDTLWVPVIASEPCDREIPETKRYRGRGYYMVGDIAVLHGKEPTRAEIDAIAGFCHPRGIVWIKSLQDVTRTPETQLVWGTGGEVCHKEAGFSYILNPEKVMFSMGNREEKTRIADMVRKSPRPERIADMFAGIGYFSIPLAAAGAAIHAMEINPIAFGYLVRSISANNLDGRITPSLGDCRQLLSGTYDRIIMGHFDAVTMLPDALRHAACGSVIHVHSIGPAEEQVRAQVEGAGFSATIHVHKVKKYRPHAWHMVQDVYLA
ncbi:MAG: SAM-dependent methyltransferase [Methanoregula sp.]|jgi:tRNA wybutosine-synthesizing protein 2